MKENDLYKLDEVFDPEDLEWRIQHFTVYGTTPDARVLVYVTSRAVQNRLDAVCGKAGWNTEIRKLDNGAYTCRLSIWIESVDEKGNVIPGTGRWVTKEDGADETNIEATKGGISGAIKRAAVQWGIGRYLYEFGESKAVFVDEGEGKYSISDKGSKSTYYWNPPAIPTWALPKNQLSHKKHLLEEINAYIQDGTLSGDYKLKAESYLNTVNINGMEGVLDYCWNEKHKKAA